MAREQEAKMGAPPVCFVVAMRAEAAPLIAELGLERSPLAGPFPVFLGEGTALVLSGVGKVAAAAATLHLHARLGEPGHAAWLNVGIAGHRERALGEGVLAHKVTDAGARRSWYPPLLFERPAPTCEVVTVEEVERAYEGDGAYEMEASGFVAAASRLASAELIQVFKVVSDNVSSPVKGIDGGRIRAWIGDRIGEISALRTALRELARELAQSEPDDEALAPFLERWHFSVTERRRLRRLVERLQAVGGAADPRRWEGLRDAGEVLRAVEETVEERFFGAPLQGGKR